MGLVKNRPDRVKAAEDAYDDVAISLLLNDCMTSPDKNNYDYYCPTEFVNLHHNKRSCTSIEDHDVYVSDENIFHFRNKTDDNVHYSDRDVDLTNYANQLRHFYHILRGATAG